MIYDLQKASMWKRIAAWIFDSILMVTLAVGFAFLISELVDFDGCVERVNNYYLQYGQEYGIDMNISSADYEALSEDQVKVYEEALQALNEDEDAVNAFTKEINLTLLIVTFGILLSMLVLEFAIPLAFKNGQTLGKKAFSIGVMRTDGIRINSMLLFIRVFLGKFTIETMIPVLLALMILFGQMGSFAMLVIMGILLLQIILLIATKTNSAIHDLMAKTVAVDLSSQMIFDTEADLVAYKERIHAEQAARQDY